jgi:predicted amidohydrolase
VISPEGRILATTSAQSPYATVDVDLAAPEQARDTHPRYVFAGRS